MNKPIKISIVTVCYNSSKTIEDTILSVLGQSYQNIEYIIVDGGSTDGTLAIIEKYKKHIAYFVSEPDKGLYDAINKGIKASTGDVVGIINSDDVLASYHTIKSVAVSFSLEGCEALYGNLIYTDASLQKTIRTWKSKPYQEGLFLKGWMPAHPTFYAKKELFEKYGYYNTSFKISADYELMLRFIHKHGVKPYFLDRTLVKMRNGGISNNSLKARVQSNREDRKSWEINGLKPKIFTLLRKPLGKLGQFLNLE